MLTDKKSDQNHIICEVGFTGVGSSCVYTVQILQHKCCIRFSYNFLSSFPDSIMNCEVCDNPFNDSDKKPRNLLCGHAFCTQCVKCVIKHKALKCPKCRKPMHDVKLEDLPVNYPILSAIEARAEASTSSSTAQGSPHQKSSTRTPTESQNQINIHTEKRWSPHGGRCLDVNAGITFHCATCQLWLCEDCGKIDHTGPFCTLTPHHETLSQMIQSCKTEAGNVCRNLQLSKREIVTYGDRLQACKAIMESCMDCIKKEEKRLEQVTKECNDAEANIRKVVEDKTHRDLPQSLSMLQSLGVTLSQSQKLMQGLLSTLLDDKAFKLSKVQYVGFLPFSSCTREKGTAFSF